MANCIYLTAYNGTALTCPAESPSDARCQICLLLLLLDKGLHISRPKPIPEKLPV